MVYMENEVTNSFRILKLSVLLASPLKFKNFVLAM